MTKKKNKHTGLAPSKEKIAEMAGLGYALGETLAAQFKVGESTIRYWISKKQLPVPEGVDVAKTPLTFKASGCRWILAAAVAKKTALAGGSCVMGYMRHHAIVVTGIKPFIQNAHSEAVRIFREGVTPIVSGVMNGEDSLARRTWG